MNTVAGRDHVKAAQKFREIYATYTDAEDLISIGAFSPGSNKRIDGSIALIDRIQSFLIQGPRERTRFDETARGVIDIARAWDNLLRGPNRETAVTAHRA
jgi:flagellum-specific ATP synthase